MNVLISSVGRRSQLIECFRSSLDELRIRGQVYGCDLDPTQAPAAHLVDRCFRVPRCTSSEFIPELLDLCRRHDIRLIVPTIDTELEAYARSRMLFRDAGVNVAVSGWDTVQIACDKVQTHEWLIRNEFPTVPQANVSDVLKRLNEWAFPVIVKPRNGSASIGVRTINSPELLAAMAADEPGLLVQGLAQGREYTINAFVNSKGECVCAVPHLRVETRGGEVSKAQSSKNRCLMEMARSLAEKLPTAYAAINIQCFLHDEKVNVVEINARFGGGFPLAHRAGAVFPRWLLEETLGVEPTTCFDGWVDGLTMLRYDSAVFLAK
jgi:carbamoyl-phosphate synthase large subunit